MGFLSKLFGNKDDLTDEINKTEKPAENSGMPILRTAFKDGYDKAMTLAALDTLNKEILLLQQAYEAKKNGAAFEMPPAAALPEIPVGRAGFNKEDVDEYIAALQQKISELRAQLG